MNEIMVLIKNNVRLLFRNKGFLMFFLVLPILSLLILYVKEENLEKNAGSSNQIINELQNAHNQVVYLADMSYYTVKVFDSSESQLTDYVLEQLLNTGMFTIYRYNSKGMTEKEVFETAKENANQDRIGSILYFSSDFETEILSGKLHDSVAIYHASEDERQEIFEESFKETISILLQCSENTKGNAGQLLDDLKTITDTMPAKQTRLISNSDTLSLTSQQKKYSEHIGYSYAILTLCFLLCGIFIAHTVIEERDNRVYTRITLSYADVSHYIISKLMVSALVSFMQTVIIGVGLFLIIRSEFGIDKMSFLFFIFLIGLIFNTLSLCVGVITGNAMGANYVVYTIWSVSSLLSGLYFSIESSTGWFKSISNLMPQKWFLRAAEMIMTGDKSAYSMVLCVTAAFLIVILSIGAAGLKLKHEV